MAFRLVMTVLLSLIAAGTASAANPPWDGVRWGETSDDLARTFGKAAMRLSEPIDYGDTYVDVVLRDEPLGGYPFQLFFQMDKRTHGLKRLMFERQRHGANPGVFRAVVGEFETAYGPPAERCQRRARPGNGYRAASEYIWREGGRTIRIVLRDTTLEASEGCLEAVARACGLTGQLFVRIAPAGEEPPGCG